jgi:peptide/nickel transport system substrate-binding protein
MRTAPGQHLVPLPNNEKGAPTLSKKLWLSIAMIVVGGALLISAGFASPSGAATGKKAAKGGTLVYDTQGDFQFMDPQISYYALDWTVLQATCVKLLNFPDGNGPKAAQLQPEAATGFPKVSNGGKRYDFTVSAPWTKFYPGNEAVTANSFKTAFDRILDPKMQSPATQFIDDVASYSVKGNHFIVNLKKQAPDFLARIGMQFFCAVPANLPHDPNGVTTPPMAGPYYIADWTKGKSLTMKANPNYKGKRPHNLDGINWVIGNSPDATQLRIQNGDSDIGGIPTAAYASIAQQYGVNKGRFWVQPAMSTWYLGLNHDRPLFGAGGANGNVNLKKAVNYALDRKALIIQRGAYSGKRTDQILPPNMPGYKEADIYPTIKPPNFTLANKLAQGHTGDGKAVLYTFSETYGPLWAQVVQFDLKQIGIDVSVQPYPRSVQIGKIETKGEPFDIGINGWGADYADPYDFLNVLLDGSKLQAANNVNISYFNSPTYNKKLQQASALSGANRLRGYGNLDIEIMRNVAPFAPILNGNNRYFVSSRLGCWTFQPVLAVPNLAGICIK